MGQAPPPDTAAKLSWKDESLPVELPRRLFLEENREAIDAWNKWLDEHGSPLDRYRAF